MERRIKEAVRYLGYGRNAADERTLALIEDAFAELERTAAPKSVCRIFDVEQTEDGRIIIGNMEIRELQSGQESEGMYQKLCFLEPRWEQGQTCLSGGLPLQIWQRQWSFSHVRLRFLKNTVMKNNLRSDGSWRNSTSI